MQNLLQFYTILPLTLNSALNWNGGVGPNKKNGFRLGCYKLILKLYVSSFE